MLNKIIGRSTKKKSFVSLFVMICLIGFPLLLKAAPQSDKTDKNKVKAGNLNKIKTSAPILKPEDIGQWITIEPQAQVVPVHMSVLPDGKVIYWGDGEFGGSQTSYQIWDPKSLKPNYSGSAFSSKTSLPPSFGNLYCSGHSFLPDGRLMVTGGQEASSQNNSGNYYMGIKKTAVFDHDAGPKGMGEWTQLAEMNDRRWYPTNLTLGNGNTLVWAGVSERLQLNKTPQILEKQADGTLSWRSLNVINQERYNIAYSWLHLLSSGKVLVIYGTEAESYALSLGERFREARLFDYPLHPTNAAYDGVLTDSHGSGSSVIFEKDKILVVGGDHNKTTAEVLDMTVASPQWKRVGRLVNSRRHSNATLLADGKVLVTGGTQGVHFNSNCLERRVYKPELWNPDDPGNDSKDILGEPGKWKEMAPATQERLYHSTAVLLPSGQVLTGGTTKYWLKDECDQPKPDQDLIADNYKLEVFSPPYLFKNGVFASRPEISNAPTQPVSYGQTIQFTVTGTSLGSGSKVNLIRLPSVTHSSNQNQGFNKLPVTIAGQNFSVTIPTNRNECPPGHYMMFVINTEGVPSEAAIIQVL